MFYSFITAFYLSVALNGETPDVCPILSDPPEKVTFENNSSAEPFVDQDRWIKDENTKIIVKEFFKTPETLFNFFKLAYLSINSEVANYKKQNSLKEDAIVVIFKGGNVLRMIAKTLFDRVSPEARDILVEKYDPYVQRSDADFSILIDFNKLNNLDYEKVRSDIVELSYNTLNKLRSEFETNPFKYFNLLQLKSEVGSQVLGQYLSNYSESDDVKQNQDSPWFNTQFLQLQLLDYVANAKMKCAFQGRFDYQFNFSPDKKSIEGMRKPSGRSWIANTINQALEYKTGLQQERTIKFDLVRSKVQFEVVYKKDGKIVRKGFPGELLDLSIPNKFDTKFPSLLAHLEQVIADYTLSYEEADDSFQFKSESVEGLANDLMVVVFAQARPWDDRKYEKRLNRIFLLSMVEMFSTYGMGSSELSDYLKEVKAKFVEPFEQLFSQKEPAQKGAEMVKEVEKLSANYPELVVTNRLLLELAKVAEKLITAPQDEDEENFKTLLDVIKDNVATLDKLMQLPAMTIDKKQVYQIKMRNIL